MYRFQNHALVWNITPTLLVYNLMQAQISLVQNSQTNWQTPSQRNAWQLSCEYIHVQRNHSQSQKFESNLFTKSIALKALCVMFYLVWCFRPSYPSSHLYWESLKIWNLFQELKEKKNITIALTILARSLAIFVVNTGLTGKTCSSALQFWRSARWSINRMKQ